MYALGGLRQELLAAGRARTSRGTEGSLARASADTNDQQDGPPVQLTAKEAHRRMNTIDFRLILSSYFILHEREDLQML